MAVAHPGDTAVLSEPSLEGLGRVRKVAAPIFWRIAVACWILGGLTVSISCLWAIRVSALPLQQLAVYDLVDRFLPFVMARLVFDLAVFSTLAGFDAAAGYILGRFFASIGDRVGGSLVFVRRLAVVAHRVCGIAVVIAFLAGPMIVAVYEKDFPFYVFWMLFFSDATARAIYNVTNCIFLAGGLLEIGIRKGFSLARASSNQVSQHALP